MGKTFVSCAIDHGTTNSSIAVMEPDGPRVVKPDGINAVMPSAVYYTARGRELVGHAAANAILTSSTDEGAGYTGYKIRMGHDDRYEFPNGKVLRVPEMGGIVIAALMQAVRGEGYPDCKSAVITVPAKFETPACVATQEAAKHAGLLFAPTLMEPVAAAMAYDFLKRGGKAKWMIFDLGGGTLDISLVVAQDAHITVLPKGNTGDNFLGGRKFDRELLDYVLGPRRSDRQYAIRMDTYRKLDPDYHPLRAQYDLENFSEEANRRVWGALLMAVEKGKIALSDSEETVIECPSAFEDAKGRLVKVEVPVRRQTYERLIASDVERAVHACRNLLDRNRLKPSEIERLILIGGPSKTPYIHQVLHDRLGIRLESSIDPMTAVAQGAAIFADTMEIPDDVLQAAGVVRRPEKVNVKLEYARASSVPISNVSGCIVDAEQDLTGWSVEIKRKDGLWSSGRQPIDDASGIFDIDVSLIEATNATQSQFETRILDAGGNVVHSIDEPNIWYPQTVPDDVLPHDLMVGVRQNDTDVLLRQGTKLPAEATGDFTIMETLHAGSSDDVLEIPVFEGVEHFLGSVDPHADANVRIGELRVQARDQRVSQDVPRGSRVEVTLHRNRDRQITLQACIPSLNEEFEAVFNARSQDPSVNELEASYERQRQQLLAIEKLDKEHPTEEVADGLRRLAEQYVTDQIETKLTRSKEGDRSSQSHCHRDILGLTGALYYLRDKQAEARLRQRINTLRPKLDGAEAEELKSLEADLEQALVSKDKKALESIESSLGQLYVRARLQPFLRLCMDLLRFPSNFRGTQPQLNAYRQAVSVAEDIIEKQNKGQEITDGDLQKAQDAQEQLWKHWASQLASWPPPDMSDIEKAGGVIRLDHRA